jgi:hypothetical protein
MIRSRGHWRSTGSGSLKVGSLTGYALERQEVNISLEDNDFKVIAVSGGATRVGKSPV